VDVGIFFLDIIFWKYFWNIQEFSRNFFTKFW